MGKLSRNSSRLLSGKMDIGKQLSGHKISR